MAETSLKPCPFCGGDPYSHQVDYCDPPEWTILCLDGDCGGSHSTEAEAIAAWNRRATDPAVPELVEALKEASAALEAASDAICAWDHHDPSVAARCNLAYRAICVALVKHAASPRDAT